MSLNDVIARIEDIYARYGDYICVDLEKGKTWIDSFKGEGFTEEESTILDFFVFEGDTGAEIETECFADKLCEIYGYKLEIWETEQVFESCGLDIFVMSFAVSNGPMNDWSYSFHNIYESC